MNRWQDFKKLRWKLVTVFISLFVFIGFLFQNCGQARLNLNAQPSQSPNAAVKGEFCPRTQNIGSSRTKFLFVFDMSASNIGQWQGDTRDGYFWKPSFATDMLGSRFEAVGSFLSTVSGNGGSSAEAAIIGFSNKAGVPAVTSNGSSTFLCDVDFKPVSDSSFLATLANLKTLQTTEYTTFYRPFESTKFVNGARFGVMQQTSYSSALDCVHLTLSKDMRGSQNREPSTYLVLFLTDGQPTEPPGVGCENVAPRDRPSCYEAEAIDKTKTIMQTAAALSANIRVQPVFYTTPISGAGVGAVAPQVSSVLQKMAIEGGTGNAMAVSGVTNLASNLGRLISGITRVEYKLESATTVNLSVKLGNGKLESDSDMDGVSDSEEVIRGYDPTKARTNGLFLDGICEFLGGKSSCGNLAIMCTSDERRYSNSIGLTECDVKALQLKKLFPSQQEPGVDSDKDGVPDFVEIVKGTNPTRSDMTDDLDFDGKSNRVEISLGTDPAKHDSSVPVHWTTSSSEKRLAVSSDDCETGLWKFGIDRMPGLPVSRFSSLTSSRPLSPDSKFGFMDFSHVENENVLLVTFELVPQNVSGVPTQVWGATVKVRYRPQNQGPGGIDLREINLESSDFSLLGEFLP